MVTMATEATILPNICTVNSRVETAVKIISRFVNIALKSKLLSVVTYQTKS